MPLPPSWTRGLPRQRLSCAAFWQTVRAAGVGGGTPRRARRALSAPAEATGDVVNKIKEAAIYKLAEALSKLG